MFGNDAQNDDISTVNPTLDSSDSVAPVTVGSGGPSSPISPPGDSSTAPTVEPTEAPEVTPTPVAEPLDADNTEDTPIPEVTPVTDEPAKTDDTPISAEDADLLSLKKQALEELSPLIDKLDQTPEEKFKTTMMMIQATDSASLVKVAHEAATAITDEKIRAQALLDIINEINYFTQKDDE